MSEVLSLSLLHRCTLIPLRAFDAEITFEKAWEMFKYQGFGRAAAIHTIRFFLSAQGGREGGGDKVLLLLLLKLLLLKLVFVSLLPVCSVW